ncbi:hypothetical protein F443_13711 [Phytophthora nicotianae P1569]|uniref:Uncharacterized protein n=2 Tax=Phytophthora nicotianae TaxID=4792 RepID=V9ERA1_PHYNI|nr:hypothetical protein F443_13711 [Phytophthora nicotianae P1569]ETO69693.1 hypothetical protein F444_13767 [Phytophthora nicotianae P1976]
MVPVISETNEYGVNMMKCMNNRVQPMKLIELNTPVASVALVGVDRRVAVNEIEDVERDKTVQCDEILRGHYGENIWDAHER